MSHIEIDHITKQYGSKVVLQDVNLQVESGEFLTLLGPSGCGKTTLLSILAGLITPDGGELRVAGQVISAPGRVVPPEQRHMGMVFQNYALWPHMTVFENVAFGLRVRRQPAAEISQKVASALALVNLSGMEERYPSQLSGGQQQRVALARSLIVEPTVLLLDEPLSNLDAKLRERMLTELKRIQRTTHITFVYVTHDQTEALAMSDRIAVMNEGVLQACASPREVYERPANRFVAEFMGVVNSLEATLVAGPDPDGLAAVKVQEDVVLKAWVTAAGTSRLVVVVRPEDLQLSRARPDSPNVLGSVVTESVYRGDHIDYRLQAGTLSLRVQAPRGQEFQVGDTAYVTLPPERCVGIAAG